jgi:hypothetical protein
LNLEFDNQGSIAGEVQVVVEIECHAERGALDIEEI